MPNFHHIDHLQRFAEWIKVGARIKKGDLLGYCGKSGTESPHCHYEVMNGKPERWLQYPAKTWSLTEIRKHYLDPSPWITDTLPMKWNRLGYDFLSAIAGGGYHLGKDLNYGSGSADLGFPIYATCDGVIEYVGDASKDGGAGNNLWWSETINEAPMNEYLVFESEKTGQFALVQNNFRRVITPERSGQAALYCVLHKLEGKSISLKDWEAIPAGKNF